MIAWNLQYFAEEKTERATPRRRSEIREKGQVPRSTEVNVAFGILAALLILRLTAGTLFGESLELFRKAFTDGLRASASDLGSFPFFWSMLSGLAGTFLLFLLGVLAVGAVVGYLQSGGVFSLHPLIPDFSRIHPVNGLKRMFSPRSLVELAKNIAKTAAIGYVGYSVISPLFAGMGNLMIMSVPDAFAWLGAQAYAIGWRVVLLLLAIAVIDYAYQRYEFEKSIRMGKQEIKDELKRTEGNPLIKSKIKERQRALATRRMIQRVPTADVVITNPTHYAVALKYSPETMDAPCVIAKGVDRIAQNIKRVAAEHGVVLVENRPLAQALYKTVDVDQAIPPALFQAVAEVLAYVYRLKKKM